MKTRPGALVFLALLQLLTPAGNLLFGAILSNLSLIQYLNAEYILNGPGFFVESFLPQMITAYAIFIVKPWSVPVCIGTTLWHIARMESLSEQYSNSMTVPILITAHLVNLSLIYYFLIPQVREVYFNRRLRWWQSKARYHIDQTANLIEPEKKDIHVCELESISRIGMFLKNATHLDFAEICEVQFSWNGIDYAFKGKVTNKSAVDGKVGVQFTGLKKTEIRALRKLLKQCEANAGIVRVPERVSQVVEFKAWAKTAIMTRKGFLPVIEAEVKTETNTAKIISLIPHLKKRQEQKEADVNKKKAA